MAETAIRFESNVQAAIYYADKGWQVFPIWWPENGHCACPKGANCDRPAKHPMTEHGLKDATTDKKKIAKWWYEYPKANIGIRTGRESGIIVIDLDVSKDKDGITRLKELNVKYNGGQSNNPTQGQKTGSGGMHLLYRYPDGKTIKNLSTGLMVDGVPYFGIDVRGDNGYILAAPSKNMNGDYILYEGEVVNMPQWLTEIIVKRSATTSGDWSALNDERYDETYSLIAQFWPAGKNEDDLPHHDFTLAAASAMLKAGVPMRIAEQVILQANENIKAADGLIHSPHDLKRCVSDAYSTGISASQDAIENDGLTDAVHEIFIGINHIWRSPKHKVKDKQKEANDDELYFPGPKDVYDQLMKEHKFKTITEVGTDHEDIWYFTEKVYERAEEYVRSKSHELFVQLCQEMLDRIEDIPFDDRGEFENNLYGRLKSALHNGPREGQINEVLAMIRRTTFTDAEAMNPLGYIPFSNGLLNISSRKLVPFTDELFYTYQVNANLMEGIVTLVDTPLFAAQLNQVFYPWDIPVILSYFGYCLYPDLPVHKVLGIFGRERIGKGTLGRVLKGLLGHGLGSFSLARILTAERFSFTGIEGKNVLVDFELKRKFKRGTVKDWSAFNNLFGQDVLSVEKKGKEAQDRISKAKGIVIGNLPIFAVDDAAAIERWLPIVTKSKKPTHLKPNVDNEIIENERDKIATLLVHTLFGLIDRGWVFPGQLTPESTVEIMDKLADPVENFIDECTEAIEGTATEVNIVYNAFVDWCENKGITPIAAQTFKKNFGWTYPKKKYHRGKEKGYEFIGCVLTITEDENEKSEKTQDHFEDGTGEKSSETAENGFRGNGYRQFQHVSLTKREGRGNSVSKDSSNSIGKYRGYRAHMLELDKSEQETSKNTVLQEIKSGSNLQSDQIPVYIQSDFSVAWYDRDWYFHSQDTAYVPEELANILIERGIAKRTNI